MNIKTRLTVQFSLISLTILGVALIAIYVFSEAYREEESYNRLINRSTNLAKLLIEVDEVDEALLYKMEADNPVRLPEEAIRIYNFRNELIFELDDEHNLPFEPAFLDAVRLDSLIQFNEGNRECLGLLFDSRFDRFVITASAVDIYGHRKMKNLRNILLVVFSIGVLLAYLTGRFFAYQALRPIKHLVEEIELFSPARLSMRLDHSKPHDEIDQIAVAFNQMMERVELAFSTQKNFIANASHEMRTPLTAISGHLEVLALKPRSIEEYQSALTDVIEDVHRLNRLANRLLLLAQTETDAAEANFAACRIDEVIWIAMSEVVKIKQEYTIDVELDEAIDDDEQLKVLGSEVLLKSVIINLLENACKYSEDHHARLRLSSEAGMISITVTDQGIGIPAEDLKTIFNPFFRGQNVGTIQGHGIGLSLVKRIVTMHKGTVSIDSVLGEGTTVQLDFPALNSL